MHPAGPQVALWSPRIPQNAGAIGRLCAALGTPLHIIRPVPFRLDDASLRRAGMDYLGFLEMTIHPDWEAFRDATCGRRTWLMTTRGETPLYEARFLADDVLLFGNEPHGVSDEIRAAVPGERHLRIPMANPAARSLNLATAVAMTLGEARRQIAKGEKPSGSSDSA